MSPFIEQLTTDQEKEMKRQLDVYRQGVQDIIPTEELAEKIAKSLVTNTPL